MTTRRKSTSHSNGADGNGNGKRKGTFLTGGNNGRPPYVSPDKNIKKSSSTKPRKKTYTTRKSVSADD